MAYMNNSYYPQYPMPQSNLYQNRMDFGQSQQMQLKGRPVSSIDEAKAAQIDFDGSMFFFPDMAHQKIYTKQVMMDGTASINTYSFVEEKVPTPPSYVTKEEFDKTIKELKDSLGRSNVEQQQLRPAVSQSVDQLSSF